jgi:hypothetical protein
VFKKNVSTKTNLAYEQLQIKEIKTLLKRVGFEQVLMAVAETRLPVFV